MHAMVVAVAAWCLSLPVVVGVGIRTTPVGKVSLRGANDPPLKFRNQNSQVPFYNNVLGYALDVNVDSDDLYLTSGLFHTAWRCPMSTEQTLVVGTQGTSACTRLGSKTWGNFYKGNEANANTAATVSDSAFNGAIKGTAASWNQDAFEYGFGWGRSIAVSGDGRVAVGCPGCTGASRSKSGTAETDLNKAKKLSGLVFEYASGGTSATVKDTSFVDSPTYGPFSTFAGDNARNIRNRDENCISPNSGCSLGTSVHYRGNALIATRGRSSRTLSRGQGYVDATGTQTEGTCRNNFGKPLLGLGFCRVEGSVHDYIGDALDLSAVTADREDFPNHGTELAKQFTLKGWGYNKVAGRNDADIFGKIDQPVQTPYHSRFGQVSEAAFLFSDQNGNFNTKQDIAFGAPGYGSFGAVFVFDGSASEMPGRDATGLRIGSFDHTTVINGPQTDTVQTNFGYSLRAFKIKDITGDSPQDHIAVGAPMFTTPDYRGGAVFTYKGEGNNNNNRNFVLQNILRPKRSEISVSGRFGSAISSIDLDLDDRDEIIVGAPFNQVGCEKFTGQSYCGALYVFSGTRMNGNGNTVLPSQTVYGKEIYGMLGHAVVASKNFVFASAPGVFGEGGSFASSLIKGLDTLALDWPVNPQVQQFAKLNVVDYVTVFDSITGADATEAGGIQTVPINDFDALNDKFDVVFSLSNTKGGSGVVTLEIPDVFRDSRYTLVVAGPGVVVNDGNTEFTYPGTATDVTVTITRNSALDGSSLDEAQKLAEEGVFKLTQVVDDTADVAKEGSTVTASVSIRVADTEPSDVIVALDIIPGDGSVKLGDLVNSEVTVTNNRVTVDSLLTLRIDIKNVLPSNLLDFSTVRTVQVSGTDVDLPTWAAMSLTSESTATNPAARLTKRLRPVVGNGKLVIPLDFILRDVFFNTAINQYFPVEVTATVVGTESEASDTKELTVDDTCDIEITGSINLPQGLKSVLQGGQFTTVHTVTPKPGKAYKPQLFTDMGYAFVPFGEVAAGCETAAYYGLLCNDVFTNNVREPTTFVRDDSLSVDDVGNNVTAGCIVKPGLELTCTAASQIRFDSDVVVFENRFQVRDDLFGVDELREENIVLNTTTADLAATGCDSSNTFSGTFDIVSSSVIAEPGKGGVAWWIILLAVLGALLLALIIALVLWKVGFFKRTKPPTDGMDNSGQLDQEVAGGSFLRG